MPVIFAQSDRVRLANLGAAVKQIHKDTQKGIQRVPQPFAKKLGIAYAQFDDLYNKLKRKDGLRQSIN